jgi:hypothetical protein
MNVTLVFGAAGALVLEGRPSTLDELAAAFEALPAGTSVLMSFEKGGQGGELFRQVSKLIYASGLDVRVMDVNDIVDVAPVDPARG